MSAGQESGSVDNGPCFGPLEVQVLVPEWGSWGEGGRIVTHLLFVSWASDSIVIGQQKLHGGQPPTWVTSPTPSYPFHLCADSDGALRCRPRG